MAKKPTFYADRGREKLSPQAAVISSGLLLGLVITAFILLSQSGTIKPVSSPGIRPASTLEQAREFYDQGNYVRAIPLLESFLKNAESGSPDESLVKDLLVSGYWQTGKPGKAFALLREQADTMPGDTDTIYRLGLLSHEMKKYEQASSYYARAVEARPDQPQYHAGYGETLTELREYGRARKEWETVLKLTPEDSDYLATVQEKIDELRTRMSRAER